MVEAEKKVMSAPPPGAFPDHGHRAGNLRVARLPHPALLGGRWVQLPSPPGQGRVLASLPWYPGRPVKEHSEHLLLPPSVTDV